MHQYHNLLKSVLNHGAQKPGARDGMPGSISYFGPQMEFDLMEGFPILTTKEVNFTHIVAELLWFLRGDTNIKFLNDRNCKIWNEDSYNYFQKKFPSSKITYKEFIHMIQEGNIPPEFNTPDYVLGDCGHQYGRVFRNFNGKDQISTLLSTIDSNKNSRRHLVSSIDPANDDKLALYWCHSLFQFNVRVGKYNKVYYLDCKMYQRSADLFLGVPYNISSYSLLTFLVADLFGFLPGKFIHTFGDAHIYDNHMDQIKTILERDPDKYSLPRLQYSSKLCGLLRSFRNQIAQRNMDFDNFINQIDVEDIFLENYKSYPKISAKLNTGLK